ncbi:MAG: hypothetical protein ACO1SX_06495 [Actinomycetota bacterium]
MDLTLDTSRVAWGGRVRGVLGLSTERASDRLSLGVIALRNLTGDSNGRQPRGMCLTSMVAEQVLSRCCWQDIPLSAAEPLRLPFDLELQYGTSLDADTEVIGRIYHPEGHVDVVALGVRVLPPAEFVTLTTQLSEAAHRDRITWRNTGAQVEAILHPKPGERHGWRALRLRLARNDSVVQGRLEVDRGAILGVFRRASVRVPFQFAIEQVPNAASFFEHVFRNLASGELPLPSQPPAPELHELPLPMHRHPDS